MKKFLIKISYTVFPLWCIIVGLVFYVSLYVVPQNGGDIGRLALIPFGNQYSQWLSKSMMKDTLFQTIKSIDDLNFIHTDVLTIGDSFSQQGNGGYQNYLCEKGVTVINYQSHLFGDPLQCTCSLLEYGIIDSTNIKVLVVESVEREISNRFNNTEVDKPQTRWNPDKKGKEQNIMKSANAWSVSRARDFIYYKLGKKNSPIYVANLEKDFFSSSEPRKLYFYHDDIERGTKIEGECAKKAKQVFEYMQKKAKEKGISIIFLIAVDKYDLYQSHIVNNKYPAKTINEDLVNAIGENSSLLITKQYLYPLVEKGEKDVFKFDDTHWSYKASKVVADELYNRIQNGL